MTNPIQISLLILFAALVSCGGQGKNTAVADTTEVNTTGSVRSAGYHSLSATDIMTLDLPVAIREMGEKINDNEKHI